MAALAVAAVEWGAVPVHPAAPLPSAGTLDQRADALAMPGSSPAARLPSATALDRRADALAMPGSSPAARLLSATALDQRADALAMPGSSPAARLLSATAFDQRAFDNALARLHDRGPRPMPGARVVLLPHHWAAGDLIVTALQGLGAATADADDPPRDLGSGYSGMLAPSGFSIRRVWLLGLDHRRVGGRVGVTSSRGWSTPFGPVEVDIDGVEALLGTGLAADAPEVVGSEHSISGLVPAIRWFLPRAEIVPLAIRADARPAEVACFAAVVGHGAGDDGVVLVSVDLAHDVARTAAPRNDALCFDLMTGLDAQRILRLDDRHMDARSAVAIGITVARDTGATDFVLVERTDSSRLEGFAGGPVTSYAAAYYARARR